MAAMARIRHWLMKTEPESFSITDLQRVGTSGWDGVRSYQARNHMRDDMRVGDAVLFYHSNAKPPGVAGLAKVVGLARPDPTSWDPESKYFDMKSTPEEPRWFMVDVGYVAHMKRFVSLDELREHTDGALAGMALLHRSRLSVQPVTPQQYNFIVSLGRR